MRTVETVECRSNTFFSLTGSWAVPGGQPVRLPNIRSDRSRGFLFQFFRLIVRCQRFDQGLELAIHYGFELVDSESDAVIGEAVLREVVSADLLAAVAGADHGLALLG